MKVIALVGLAVLCAGCNLLPGSTSQTTPTTTTETFSGTLSALSRAQPLA